MPFNLWIYYYTKGIYLNILFLVVCKYIEIFVSKYYLFE